MHTQADDHIHVIFWPVPCCGCK